MGIYKNNNPFWLDAVPTHVAFRRDQFGWHVVELGSNWLKRKYNNTSYFAVKPIKTASQITEFRSALLQVTDHSDDLTQDIDLLIDEGVI